MTASSPIVTLNRAIARGQVEGPAAGLAAIGGLADGPFARGYPFFHAVVAEFSLAAGERRAALAPFTKACALACSPAERRFYDRRLQELADQGLPERWSSAGIGDNAIFRQRYRRPSAG